MMQLLAKVPDLKVYGRDDSFDMDNYLITCARALNLQSHPTFTQLQTYSYDRTKQVNYVFAVLDEKGRLLHQTFSSNLLKRWLEYIGEPGPKLESEIARMQLLGEVPKIQVLEQVTYVERFRKTKWWRENYKHYVRKERIEALLQAE